MGDYVGKSVTHKTFGNGVIVEISNGYLKVEFASVGTKQFVFPDAFNGFLAFDDEDCQENACVT